MSQECREIRDGILKFNASSTEKLGAEIPRSRGLGGGCGFGGVRLRALRLRA